jgi:hypothetical protein
MALTNRAWIANAGLAALIALSCAGAASAQTPKAPQLPNPYVLAPDWPKLPLGMNGGHWGEVIRVHVHSDGNIEVLKLSPTGKVLMMLGKEGVSGNDNETFDRPTGIAVAPNGAVFVSDGHYPNKHDNARIMKFDPTGHFIKAWGKKGPAPGDFDEPHDIFIGGSQNRVYVADRRNNRLQVFDQDGNFLAAWTQFGTPSSVFVGKDDTIYVGASFKEPGAKRNETRGIVIGNARDGSLKAFIPDPADLDTDNVGTSASGIGADDAGNIYAADVAAHNLRKYVKAR